MGQGSLGNLAGQGLTLDKYSSAGKECPNSRSKVPNSSGLTASINNSFHSSRN